MVVDTSFDLLRNAEDKKLQTNKNPEHLCSVKYLTFTCEQNNHLLVTGER